MNAAFPSNHRAEDWHLYLTDFSPVLRLYLLCLNAPAPLLLVAVLAKGLKSAQTGLPVLAVSLCIQALLLGVVYLWGTYRKYSGQVTDGVGIAIYVCFGIYWFVFFNGKGSLFILMSVGFVALFWRSHRLYRTSTLSSENRMAFLLDTVIIVFCIIEYYWGVLPGNSETAGMLFLLIPEWVLVTVLLRIYSLWAVERAESRTGRVSSRNIWFLIGLTILVAAYIRYGLIQTFFFLLGGLGLVFTPFLYLIPHFKLKPKTHPFQFSPIPSHVLHNTQSGGGENAPVFVHWLAYTCLAGVCVVLLYFLARRRSGGLPKGAKEDALEIEVVRKSLEVKSSFLQTNNPIRQRAQQWLSEQAQQREIRPTQTWHQMTDDTVPHPEDFLRFVEEYDRERYGKLKETVKVKK